MGDLCAPAWLQFFWAEVTMSMVGLCLVKNCQVKLRAYCRLAWPPHSQ
jgi:hypothetical protein